MENSEADASVNDDAAVTIAAVVRARRRACRRSIVARTWCRTIVPGRFHDAISPDRFAAASESHQIPFGVDRGPAGTITANVNVAFGMTMMAVRVAGFSIGRGAEKCDGGDGEGGNP